MKQFPSGGTFSKSKCEIIIPLPIPVANNVNSDFQHIKFTLDVYGKIIEKSYLLTLSQAIEDCAIQSHDAENEFNNDCA